MRARKVSVPWGELELTDAGIVREGVMEDVLMESLDHSSSRIIES